MILWEIYYARLREDQHPFMVSAIGHDHWWDEAAKKEYHVSQIELLQVALLTKKEIKDFNI